MRLKQARVLKQPSIRPACTSENINNQLHYHTTPSRFASNPQTGGSIVKHVGKFLRHHRIGTAALHEKHAENYSHQEKHDDLHFANVHSLTTDGRKRDPCTKEQNSRRRWHPRLYHSDGTAPHSSQNSFQALRDRAGFT